HVVSRAAHAAFDLGYPIQDVVNLLRDLLDAAGGRRPADHLDGGLGAAQVVVGVSRLVEIGAKRSIARAWNLVVAVDSRLLAGERIVHVPRPADVMGLGGTAGQSGGNAAGGCRPGRIHSVLLGRSSRVIDGGGLDRQERLVGGRIPVWELERAAGLVHGV